MNNSTEGSILITGGAGYIGSHAVLAFRDSSEKVVVIDDLSTGRRDAVPSDVPFVEGDVSDSDLVDRTIKKHAVRAVIHFAGSIVVPESVVDPLKYYRNNTCASRSLIQACIAGGVQYFIFSSTAAVYGAPSKVPVGEASPTEPINPYGASKLMTEWMLRDAALAAPLRYTALRYFNVAGADPGGRTGQSTPGATHLIKVAGEAAVGVRPYIEVFGEDYDTPDGTCVRDYIHVTDLANAHVGALSSLEKNNASKVFNCGYGRGYSVKEVLDSVQRVTGRKLDIRSAPRRAGDPPALVANTAAIQRDLHWLPQHDSLDHIVETAINWERKLQDR